MRKLIVTNIMSLDGVRRPGRERHGPPDGPPLRRAQRERLRAADTLLLGRTTYEGFKGFWPAMADNPDATEAHREISRIEDAIDKVVVSDTLRAEHTEPWRGTTEIVRRADAHARIAELKRGPGRDILMFGSRTLCHDLLDAGLVDELHLMVGCVVLGGGTPLFAPGRQASLELLGTQTFEHSSNVLVRYAV